MLGPAGPSWGHLAPSWGRLGASWGHLGTVLWWPPSWPSSWRHLGAMLGYLPPCFLPPQSCIMRSCLPYTQSTLHRSSWFVLDAGRWTLEASSSPPFSSSTAWTVSDEKIDSVSEMRCKKPPGNTCGRSAAISLVACQSEHRLQCHRPRGLEWAPVWVLEAGWQSTYASE